jgi:triosephosphate isomerase
MRRYLVAGNWKMNLKHDSAVALAKSLAASVPGGDERIDVLVAPPFPYLISVKQAVAGSAVTVGAQNAYFENPGAFTGETSVEMLVDVGCKAVILGHSERRHVLGETDAVINKKVKAVLEKGLDVILCVGELLADRDSNQTEAVLDKQMEGGLAAISEAQMAKIVIAYEPVWAIGTGRTASPAQAESAHAHLRNWLKTHYTASVADATRILYGGSVKADNASELLAQPNVDGALVGGASLKPEQFLPIIQAAQALAK